MSTTSSSHTILLIDDEATSLKIVVSHLRAHHIEILTARNGETGLERALMTQPNLIVLDVAMPGIDGFETCRRLKANPATASIPVIFMTALSDVADKVRGLELGAVDYIGKPLDPAELLARVRVHLALRDLQERLEERVRQRTTELEAEIAHRQQQQAEKDRLFQVMQHQSEQLRTLTQLFLETQQRQQQGLSQTIQDHIQQNLRLVTTQLHAAQQILTTQIPASTASQLATDYLDQARQVLLQLQQLTEQVTTDLSHVNTEQQQLLQNPLLRLSAREREVLHFLVAGRTTTEIAAMLVLSKGTVSTYRHRIMEKLELPDFPSLVKFAMQHRLLRE
jgi:DNA-binding response OmpR family regulator/DNA-binding CsgD family transcriptional regulator